MWVQLWVIDFFAQPVGRDYCEMIKWEVLEEIETFFFFFREREML